MSSVIEKVCVFDILTSQESRPPSFHPAQMKMSGICSIYPACLYMPSQASLVMTGTGTSCKRDGNGPSVKNIIRFIDERHHGVMLWEKQRVFYLRRDVPILLRRLFCQCDLHQFQVRKWEQYLAGRQLARKIWEEPSRFRMFLGRTAGEWQRFGHDVQRNRRAPSLQTSRILRYGAKDPLAVPCEQRQILAVLVISVSVWPRMMRKVTAHLCLS